MFLLAARSERRLAMIFVEVKTSVEVPMKTSDRHMQLFQDAMYSSVLDRVRRRIFRQLIESMLYEGIIEVKTNKLDDSQEQFIIPGYDSRKEAVHYVCQGRRRFAFERIRLLQGAVIRVSNGKEEECECIATFLEEVSPFFREETSRLEAFIHELEQTLVKDALAQYDRWRKPHRAYSRSYDDLEGEVMDGHPYHPCYKSRIGFDLMDNESYGPDFSPRVQPLWAGVKKTHAELSCSRFLSYEEFIQSEIGKEKITLFMNKIQKEGGEPEEYLLVPIHPWQWREKISTHFFRQISERKLILMGTAEDLYSPQQSIRTLANRTSPNKAYLKLSLSIRNTSSSRILSPRHVRNGPIVSDWLWETLATDRYLKEQLRLVFLREVMGVSYQYNQLPTATQQKAEGTLAAIWRESLHHYLEPGEEAAPFTALCHLGRDGLPFIHPWVKSYGLDAWIDQLLLVSLLPLLHLLYAHGIAVESHAQNMVLIHRQGLPVRLAVRDFSGGVLLYKDRPNPALFPETDQAAEVRDVFHNALFFINLAEFSLFLQEHYQLSEEAFWKKVSGLIKAYQEQNTSLKCRFALFDLFEERVKIGQLTKRRLYGNDDCDHFVRNVLYPFREER